MRVDYFWSREVPFQVWSLLLANDTLLAAGHRLEFDGDLGTGAVVCDDGLLWAVTATGGETITEYELPSPPVWDGMAAAGGRLYFSTKDGHLVCMGGE